MHAPKPISPITLTDADKTHPLFSPRETRHMFQGNHGVCPANFHNFSMPACHLDAVSMI